MKVFKLIEGLTKIEAPDSDTAPRSHLVGGERERDQVRSCERRLTKTVTGGDVSEKVNKVIYDWRMMEAAQANC